MSCAETPLAELKIDLDSTTTLHFSFHLVALIIIILTTVIQSNCFMLAGISSYCPHKAAPYRIEVLAGKKKTLSIFLHSRGPSRKNVTMKQVVSFFFPAST